jgi:hypothetical protein
MMMIGITLSLGAILVAWAGQSYGAFSGGSQLYYGQREQALQENFVIEEVFFVPSSLQNSSCSPSCILVFVRNVGLININVTAIYVNGAPIIPITTGSNHGWCSYSGTTKGLAVGQVCEFGLNYTWVSNSVVVIVVASQRGNQATSSVRGP